MDYSIIDNTNLLSGPLHVSFEITNKCMLKCMHCYNRSGDDLYRNELTDDKLLLVAKELADFKLFSFCFCGGETLLKYETILKMAKILKQTCQNIGMVTNGYLLDENKAKALEDAGINLIQISVDGATKETHDYMRGVEGAFDRAINALEILDKHSMDVAVAFSPTSFNIKEFPDLVEKLRKYKKLKSLRIQPLMLLGRGAINDISPTESQYRGLVNYIAEAQLNEKIKFNIEWGDPVDHLLRFSGNSFKNSLFSELKSDGSIYISSYLPIVVGNLKNHSLKEYWNNGLGKVWNIPLVKEIASEYASISSLGKPTTNIPKVFYEKNIEFDLIDDKVFENLDKYTCENFFGGR